jgi:hypothetical protein
MAIVRLILRTSPSLFVDLQLLRFVLALHRCGGQRPLVAAGTPRVVLLGGCEVMLRVERRWIEEPVGSSGGERRRMFQVRLEDGRRCRLAQEPDGSWTLAHAADGR